MIRLNMHEAKTHLSRYVARFKEGETIILCRRDEPVAEIRALPPTRKKSPTRKKPRPFGLARGQFTVPSAFFEPLPEEVIQSFERAEPAHPRE